MNLILSLRARRLAPGALMIGMLATGPAFGQSAADPVRGQALFAACSACHGATPDARSVGPSLAGVLGRRAGVEPDATFSSALKGAGVLWTPETLDRFLADPQNVAPGSTMPTRVRAARDRADLIAYLATLK